MRKALVKISPTVGLLAASVMCNVLMGIALLMPEWVQALRRQPTPHDKSYQAQLVPAREVYEALRECRVPLNVAYRALAASLPKPITHTSEYWLPAMRREMLNDKERFELHGVLRDFVEHTVGPQAADSEAFVELFRPLQDRFPFLPPGKQTELERIWLLERQALVDAQAAGEVRVERVRELRARTERAIGELLTDEEMLEYQLRDSRISRALLSSGFDFSEKEFRDSAMALLASRERPMDDRSGAQQAYGNVDDKLATILSPERLQEFRKRQQQSTQLIVEARPSPDVRVKALPAEQIIAPATTN